MIKRIMLFLLAGLMLSTGSIAQDAETIRIGALTKNVDNPFFERMIDGYEFAAERYDVEIVIGSVPTEPDRDQQVEILNDWLENENLDGLIVTPFRSDNLTTALVQATEQGIPIINTDELIPDDLIAEFDLNIVSKIASNNVRAGSVSAEYLVGVLEPGTEIAVVEGAVGTQSSIDRVQGFILTAERNGLRIVTSQPANWDRAEATTVTESILEQFPDIGAIFAANDSMGLGVVDALEAAGRSDDILVLSVDAIPDALAAVEAGSLEGTVAQYPEEMAVLAVEAMRKAVTGRPVAPEIESPVVLITADQLAAASPQLGEPMISDDVLIGALTKNIDNGFFVQMVEGYEQVAGVLDVAVEVASTPTEAEQGQQAETLQAWIASGSYDAFVITPFRSDNLNTQLVEASAAGLPIINTDELIPQETIAELDLNVVIQIASNNVRAGSLAAAYMVDNLEPGTEVAVIEGAVGTQSSIDRVQGFILGAERNGLRVVASQPANWDTDEAYAVTLGLLEQFPDVGGIFAANDGMAFGVIRALEETGRTDVIVLSVDGTAGALEAIAAGQLAGSVAQFPDEMAVLAVEAAIKVVEGRPVAPFIESPVALITIADLE